MSHCIVPCGAVHLYDRMPSCGRFDGAPASLGFVVSPVVRLRLHLNVKLILVGVTGNGPLQRGERRDGDAAEHQGQEGLGGVMENAPGVQGVFGTFESLAVLLIHLQMLETSGLCHIWGMTKKGSAGALTFVSWSQDTT